MARYRRSLCNQSLEPKPWTEALELLVVVQAIGNLEVCVVEKCIPVLGAELSECPETGGRGGSWHCEFRCWGLEKSKHHTRSETGSENSPYPIPSCMEDLTVAVVASH